MTIRYGRALFNLVGADDYSTDLLVDTFGDLRVAVNVSGLVVRVSACGQASRLRVGDEELSYPSEALLLRALVQRLNRLGLDSDDLHVHLHAAAVCNDRGRSAILSATSGTGKSTLCAALLLSGCRYHTDENVAVLADGTIETDPKPLSLRGEGESLLEAFASDLGYQYSPGQKYLKASLLGAIERTSKPSVVAILERSQGSCSSQPPVSVDKLLTAEAMYLLLQESPDIERASTEGVRRVAALCAHARCVRLSIGDLHTTTAKVGELLALKPPASSAVVIGNEEGDGTDLLPGTSMYLFTDSALLYSKDSRQLCWIKSDGRPDWLELADHALLSTLRQAGFIR